MGWQIIKGKRVMTTKKKKVRAYDVQRKEDTLKRLRDGFDELKSSHPNKAVTKYELSKHTGVARQTISKYSEIVELLDSQQEFRGTRSIKTKKDVKRLIDSTEMQLKEKDRKYEDLLKENTQLNLKIVRLTDEVSRLEGIIERYKKVIENEN